MMPTVFMNARIAHLPLDVAWALQIATSLAAVAAVVLDLLAPARPRAVDGAVRDRDASW